jgi:hypothetical protein
VIVQALAARAGGPAPDPDRVRRFLSDVRDDLAAPAP